MEAKYSREVFDGYTDRFIIEFKTEDGSFTLNIYSNSPSLFFLEDFINVHKSEKVVSFKITHRSSKYQDEAASKFIDDI
jgi:hypothetical protein